MASINIGSKRRAAGSYTDPPPTPTPPTPTPSRQAGWPHGLGACAWLSQVVADDASRGQERATLKSLGVTHVRSFANSCKKGGNFDTGDDSKVKRLLARGIKYVGMFGAPENDASNTTFDLDDWKRYFDGVAKWRADNSNIIVELNNEINLTQYLPIGDTQNGRQVLAQGRCVPSGSREDRPRQSRHVGVHRWAERRLAGVHRSAPELSEGSHRRRAARFVNAINTHLYFTTAPQMELVLSSYRSWVPKDFPIFLTETNFHGTQPSNYAHVGEQCSRSIVKYGVTPFVYRFCPTGSNGMDAIDLTDGKGNINSIVTKTWGLA
jgi:hypothetical protein